MELVNYHEYHQHQIEEVDGKKILPLEGKHLVDTQTRE